MKQFLTRLGLLAFLAILLNACKKSDSLQLDTINSPLKTVSPAAVTATIAADGVCDYNLDESILSSNGWSKVFEDEFSASLGSWNIWNGGAYNNELQLYQAGNLLVNSGVLTIKAIKETVSGPTLPSDPTLKSFDFTSGRIESKANFSASTSTPKVRMSARIKLPTGYGMWPAFWSYGDPWPTHGEIDIMEARGNEPYQYQTAYWYGRRSGVNQASGTEGYITSSVNLADCWHVYEVVWEKNSLTYYLDGKAVDVKTGGLIPNFFRKTQRVVLNLAVGGGFFGNPDPSTIQTGSMQIDWVKVFTAR
ncbi:MAG TPA: glycoside hydrolase family 16 protein [Flavisolibacter sp.]|nr:glycoside hydrolase family 16 protein [Flavisolibacter sp.]